MLSVGRVWRSFSYLPLLSALSNTLLSGVAEDPRPPCKWGPGSLGGVAGWVSGKSEAGVPTPVSVKTRSWFKYSISFGEIGYILLFFKLFLALLRTTFNFNILRRLLPIIWRAAMVPTRPRIW